MRVKSPNVFYWIVYIWGKKNPPNQTILMYIFNVKKKMRKYKHKVIISHLNPLLTHLSYYSSFLYRKDFTRVDFLLSDFSSSFLSWTHWSKIILLSPSNLHLFIVTCYSKWGQWTNSISISLLEMQNPKVFPDLLNQHLHVNRIFKWFTCTVKFGKHWASS